MKIDSATTDEITPEQDRALSLALEHVLHPSPLPDGFRSRLLSAMQQEMLRDVQAQKRALELEYSQAQHRLHRGHVRQLLDTVVLILVVTFTAGLCANLALPWLQNLLALDKAVTAPMLGILIGLVAGASVWLDRFALPVGRLQAALD